MAAAGYSSGGPAERRCSDARTCLRRAARSRACRPGRRRTKKPTDVRVCARPHTFSSQSARASVANDYGEGASLLDPPLAAVEGGAM